MPLRWLKRRFAKGLHPPGESSSIAVDHARKSYRESVSRFAGALVGLLLLTGMAAWLLMANSAVAADRMQKPLWEAYTMTKLADYVSLSSGVEPVNRDKFVIGVVGAPEVYRNLLGMVAGGKPDRIQRRPVKVVEIPAAEVATRALTVDFLFVAAKSEKVVFPVLEQCTKAGVVAIGETREFTRRGGTLRFDEAKRTVVYHRANLSKAPFGLNYRFRRYLDSE